MGDGPRASRALSSSQVIVAQINRRDRVKMMNGVWSRLGRFSASRLGIFRQFASGRSCVVMPAVRPRLAARMLVADHNRVLVNLCPAPSPFSNANCWQGLQWRRRNAVRTTRKGAVARIELESGEIQMSQYFFRGGVNGWWRIGESRHR